MINKALFSEKLKKFREKGGFSIPELARDMGWMGSTPFYEYENKSKKRIPNSETIREIASILKLSFYEERLLLGLAGHITEQAIPPIEDIKRVLHIYAEQIKEHPFPVYIQDYKGWVWVGNPAAIRFTGDLKVAEKIFLSQKNFEPFFDSSDAIQNYLKIDEIFLQKQLMFFKQMNVNRQHEPFFLAYPECIKSTLSKKDYEHFEKVWNRIELSINERNPEEEASALFHSTYEIALPNLPKVVYQVSLQPVPEFINTFMIWRHYPLGITEKDMNFSTNDEFLTYGSLKLWDLVSHEELEKRISPKNF